MYVCMYEARSAERKSTVYFKIGILREDLWSHGKFQVIIVKSLGALFSPKTRNIRYFFADSFIYEMSYPVVVGARTLNDRKRAFVIKRDTTFK